MTIETRLFAVLGTLAGGRVYPDVAPPDTAAPYLVHQQVGGAAISYQENTVPTEERCRIQLATWAASRLETTALAQQAEALLLQATTFQAEALGNRTHTHDPDTGLYGARQDFDILTPRA